MPSVLIVGLAMALLSGLLFFEHRENQKAKLTTKTLLSCLFIFTALVQAHPFPGYFYLLLIGFIFCLGGDIFLALSQEKMFLYGLVSFLLGHIFYVFGFFYAARINQWTWIGSVICLAVSGGIYFWLRPHLGSMNSAVLLYVIVITIMVIGAWSVLGDNKLTSAGRFLVFYGALGFYFSDVFVARDRFLKAEILNRLIGLPLYYFGQFLLAFSVSQLKPT